MAPFRRGRSAPIKGSSKVTTSDAIDSDDDVSGTTNHRQSAWDRRRRNKAKNGGVSSGSSKKEERKKAAAIAEEEYDPYDSDPGESYREHCERVKGTSNKSCLVMPRFLKKLDGGEPDTIATAPPSPLTSEIDDLFTGGMNHPSSLPRDMSRVKYSLRTSIGDGSQVQPTGASVMERRELRPNNIHINVSHWSDMGARNYMEDRYVVRYLNSGIYGI